MADTQTVPDHTSDETAADAFIAKWQGVTASELSTSQSYLIDLCHLLGVDTPHPTVQLDYMFERPIKFAHGDGTSIYVVRWHMLVIRIHTKGNSMFKKSLFTASLFAVLLASGCASVPMAPAAQDATLKTFVAPPADKAGLYIYRNSFGGKALKKNVYVDGGYLGESANKVYFYKQVAPGQHTVSTESEFSDNALSFEAAGGVNYFIRQYIKLGVFVGGANVELVSEDEGKKGVLESKLAK